MGEAFKEQPVFIDEHHPNQMICDRIQEAVTLWADTAKLMELAKNMSSNVITETKYAKDKFKFKVLLTEGTPYQALNADLTSDRLSEFTADELCRIDHRGAEFFDSASERTLVITGHDFEIVPIIELAPEAP